MYAAIERERPDAVIHCGDCYEDACELRQAVEQGDADRIRQAVGSFLATPEGARLAEQLRQALGK